MTLVPEGRGVVRLLIIGAGGHGAELLSYLPSLLLPDRVQLLGFIDDGRPKGPFGATAILGGVDVVRGLLDAEDGPTHYITAVGDNRVRQRLVSRIDEVGEGRLRPWTLRHSATVVGQGACVGSGVCLAPKSILTTRLTVGHHVIVNVNASVSHDCQIGDFVNLNPGVTICGNVRIGRGAYIGAGATIIDKVTIGDWAVVGAGAVVIRDVPPNVTAVGVPARIVERPAPVS